MKNPTPNRLIEIIYHLERAHEPMEGGDYTNEGDDEKIEEIRKSLTRQLRRIEIKKMEEWREKAQAPK